MVLVVVMQKKPIVIYLLIQYIHSMLYSYTKKYNTSKNIQHIVKVYVYVTYDVDMY